MLAWLLMLDKVERMRSWDARHGCYDSWYSWISCLIMTLSTVGASCRHYHYMHTWNSSHVHQAVRMSYNSQQYTISNPYYEDSKREHSESMSTWASWAHEHRERMSIVSAWASWTCKVRDGGMRTPSVSIVRAWALWVYEHMSIVSAWAPWVCKVRDGGRNERSKCTQNGQMSNLNILSCDVVTLFPRRILRSCRILQSFYTSIFSNLLSQSHLHLNST